ncbi:MAG: WGR domain-containing protein [Planctomycetota bacterium]|nr:WGR domain-containing protein [Planctomycetota bacterium]
MPRESTTLYFKEGNSDKVYHLAIEEREGGFVVNFAFGRRGSTLQTGTKTNTPVSFEQAKKIYDALIRSKTAKGYSEGPDGTPCSGTEKAEQDSGLRPQLLNPITEEEAERYLRDDAYWLQEKMDGRRTLVRKVGDEVTGINRRGLTVGLPESIVQAAQALRSDCVIDGEAVGDRLHAFDCLRRGNSPLEKLAYRDRWRILLELVGGRRGAIEVLPTAAETGDKRDLLRFLCERKAEGVVLKNRNAPYTPGRPASGGPQVKLKFYATASCIVAPSRNGKRSVGLEVLDGLKLVSVGNVTIPPNAAIPQQGQVLEVRYLYAYNGGSLYQPVYLGRRTDILTAECKLSQLKFRKEDAEEEG